MQLSARSEQKELMNYLSAYMNDPKLSVWHLMILTAILTLGYGQKEWSAIKVSRRKIMMLSHIKTLPTYHKYFKELQKFGYITYRPSFHPGSRSEVNLNLKEVIS
ncbi:hypothetical protein KHA90_07960 [Flavobacterium psychroterrae]|uniref:MarR family transcriptional regulator n=1 Tax=Flavobacterium psychroterrae TaxID=2133767 RepID=A0ABS5P9I3_9FLAO|nr:hypothetical protein [Flavobacterium psychroterrae]MBS7230955.1 hypothetical protein [Flavobacterium psychroterrae]